MKVLASPRAGDGLGCLASPACRGLHDAGFVPGGSPVENSETHAVNRHAFEAHKARGHFQAHPAASLGQRSHGTTAVGAVDAEVDVVGAPVRAVVPTALGVMPLEHDLSGWIDGVQVDVGVEGIADANAERLG